MISLSDRQLATVMAAASSLDPEKRSTYLERVAAILHVRHGRFVDSDVTTAAQTALDSLLQHESAA
jgi:hypothetical protein